MAYSIYNITEIPNRKEDACLWFSSKWNVPLEAYIESMTDCIEGKNSIPQWYLAIEDGEIIGGLGVIENDFHPRTDLTPNVCAVYVEKAYRCQGIAGELLNFACNDMHKRGINTLYLLTNHTSFYERYGWEFYCIINNGVDESRVYIHKMQD